MIFLLLAFYVVGFWPTFLALQEFGTKSRAADLLAMVTWPLSSILSFLSHLVGGFREL